jgi:hypothetical protein
MHDPDAVDAIIKWVAVALQVIGLILLVLGVAVVRSWLERATEAAAEATRGLHRWWALRSESVGRWWARRRGRLVGGPRLTSDLSLTSDFATAKVTRHRVDRKTVSDRDWLTHLDDLVESLMVLREQAEQQRLDDLGDWDRRFEAQRDALRAEIFDATRQGWALIVIGLLVQAGGIVLGALA